MIISRRLFAAGAVAAASPLVLPYPAALARLGGISQPDPYILSISQAISSGNEPFTDTADRFLKNPALVAGQKTQVFLVIGQSNAANTVSRDTPYVISNPNIQNFNIYNGGIYNTVEPYLGCSTATGNQFGQVAEKAISSGIGVRIILVPIAIGGTTVAQWNNDLALYNRINVAVLRLAAVGLSITGVLWHQGETDAFLGTSQVDYATALNGVITRSRNFGITAPWFVCIVSHPYEATGAGVRAAQANIVDHGLNIWAGPNTDTLGNNFRQSDESHFTAAGADACSTLWNTSLAAFPSW